MTRRLTPSNLAVAILAWIMLTACGQVALTEEEHFQRGLQNEQEGDLRAALIDYKNTLQVNPGHLEARLRLALASLDLGDIETARAELTRAANLGAEPSAVMLPMARIWLMDGENSRVLDELNPETLAPDDVAIRAEMLLLRGEALAALAREEEALEAFDTALDLVPGLALAHVGIAGVHMQLQRPEEARAHLERALAVDEQLYQAWDVLGDLERLDGRPEDAERAYGRAIALSGTPYPIHLKRALTRVALDDTSGVEEDLRALHRLGPAHAGTAHVQGLVHFGAGRYGEAQISFEQALTAAPDFLPAEFFLGFSHFAQEHWGQAEQRLQRVVRASPGFDEAARMLALVRLRQGDLDTVERLLTPVLARSPDDTLALSVMGNIQLARGSVDEGLDSLRRVALARPEDPSARLDLAQGLLQGGDLEGALRELGGALEQAPEDLRLNITLIMNLLQQGDFDAALRAIDNLDEYRPDDPLVHNLRALAFWGKQDIEQVVKSLAEAQRIQPGEPTSAISLARLATLQGDLDQASEIYRKALEHFPGNPRLSTRLATLEADRGNAEVVRDILEQSLERYPEVVETRVMLVRYYLQQGEPRRALSLLEPLLTSAGNDVRVLDALALAQIAAGQNAQAVTTLRTLSQVIANTAGAHHRIGQAFEQLESIRDARDQYRRSLEIDPAFAPTLGSLAALEFRDGRAEEALALAQRLQQVDSAGGQGYAIEGQIHAASGKNEEAMQALSRAYELAPAADIAVALGRVERALGQTEAAAERLQARLERYPDEHGVRFFLAELLVELGRDEAALRAYEDLVPVAPDNAIVLNNLAFLYQAAGDTRALEFAERAHALRPDSPAIADTLGWVLLGQGEVERALPLLESARNALPEDPSVRYHFASALVAVGRDSEAREELTRLLAEADSFADRDNARALLESLK